MTQVTQQASKQKPAKPAKQASAKPAKQASKQASTYAYAVLLADALGGKFGGLIQRFYVNAISHHSKIGTTFPRAAYAKVTLLTPTDAVAFLEKHRATSIPNAIKESRRLFDQMMVEAKEQASKQASK
jgi:hypothetical protein